MQKYTTSARNLALKYQLPLGDAKKGDPRSVNKLDTSFIKHHVNNNNNIAFISPRIYKGSCIANFSEKEKKKKIINK